MTGWRSTPLDIIWKPGILYSDSGGARCAATLLWEYAMTTPKKRIAFKDVVAPPLNWKAPNTASQEAESADTKKDQEEQNSEK